MEESDGIMAVKSDVLHEITPPHGMLVACQADPTDRFSSVQPE
jgi:hypothetical protein